MTQKDTHLEEMSAFFQRHLPIYEDYMLQEIPGCREGYDRMAALLPPDVKTVLDLGCGTGLEMGAIWQRHPQVQITGIDLCRPMLLEVQRKFANAPMRLLEGDYFRRAFDRGPYDAVVSFKALHHHSAEEKLRLYRKIYAALPAGGMYLEGDFAANTAELEQTLQKKYAALVQKLQLNTAHHYHFDQPLTVAHTLQLLQSAGFAQARLVWQMQDTVLLQAIK